MSDFNKLNFSDTEDFSMEDSSALEDFLNGDTSKIEKIDPKKEQKKKEEDEKKKTPVKKEATENEENKSEEEQEESIDVLEELSKEENTSDEEEEEPAAKKSASKETSEETTEDNQFEVISRQMYEAGIFMQDDEDEEAVLASSPEELLQLFQANAQKAALRNIDSFLRSRGDDRMDLFQAIFVDGVDPKEYIPAYNRVQDFENLDITDESNQEKVIREYYNRLKWSPEKINAKVQKLKDYGDLEEEAQEVHPKIVEQDKEDLEQQKLAKQQEEQTKKQNEQAYQQGVQKILVDAIKTKELAGIPVTEKLAREVAGYMLQPKYRLPNGEVISELDKEFLESKRPENLKDRVAFAILKKINFDFSKIEKKAIATKTNELFSGLQKRSVKSKTEKVQQNDDFWKGL